MKLKKYDFFYKIYAIINAIGDYMSKVRINLKLKNSNEDLNKEIIGLKRGNKIHYIDDSVKVTITFDDIVTIRRNSKEYEIILKFKESEKLDGIYNLKKLNYNLPIDIKTNKMYIDSGQFKVDYELTSDGVKMDDFLFELKYEVIA